MLVKDANLKKYKTASVYIKTRSHLLKNAIL